MREALITGGAGFIGSHLADRLLAEGWGVTAADNFDPFYDPAVKRRNVAPHLDNPRYRLVEADIRDAAALAAALGPWPADPAGAVIVHLAAKAGVRPSIADPVAYEQVNVGGTQNLLELARARGVTQFVFGSSSSVYGVNPRVPWREDDAGLRPISPYAATKVAGELLGHVYSHLHGVRFVALRFFTVYGPRQRPDLAIHKFARLIRAGRPVPLYGDGSTSRDYTYVDDIVAGIRAAMDWRAGPYAVINLGNSHTVTLAELVAALEAALGARAAVERLPDQPGDVPRTWADIATARRLLNWQPSTPLPAGLRRFVEWLDGLRDEG
ncbi:MAG: NAD-dependent epimerase/dehydratase family protein [Acidobacteria bacterium]|nr:NAD-dependent epimerase/dehydratase family protein [Acidobacteriota bacterium]